MDLRQLEYFAKVAESGGFTRASIVLAVPQPTLSKHIRRLEVELRQTLLKRNGRGTAITEQGARFLEHAKGIIEQCERARQAFNSPHEPPVGKVVVATPSMVGRTIITKLVTEFRCKFPKATLEVIETKSRFTLELLLNGRVDIGLIYDPPKSPQLEFFPVLSQKLALISPSFKTLVPRSKTVPFKDLGNFPLIVSGYPDRTRARLETEAAKANIKLNIALQIEGVEMMLELIQHGHGYAVLPRISLLRQHSYHKLQVNDIINPRLLQSLDIAVSAQRPTTRLARESITLIRDCLAESRETGLS